MSIHEDDEQHKTRLDDFSRLMLAGLSEIPPQEMENLIVTALKRYLDDDKHWRQLKFKSLDNAIEQRIKQLSETDEYKELIEERAHSILKSHIAGLTLEKASSY